MEDEPVLTAEGMQALEEKLQYLETTRRREVSEQMKRAIEHGDLWENAEYDEARSAFVQLEKQIKETQMIIARARVVEVSEIDTETVGIGSLVEVEDDDGAARQTLRVVGPTETDPDEGKISHLCPIGQALMNSKTGDVVSVNSPGGVKKYKVVSITK